MPKYPRIIRYRAGSLPIANHSGRSAAPICVSRLVYTVDDAVQTPIRIRKVANLPMLKRILLVTTLLLTTMLLSACSLWEDDESGTGENGASESPAPDELTGELVLENASARWDETESLHFVLEAEGDTFLDSDQTIRLISGEGDLARPSSVEATARVSVAVTSVNVNIIVIDDDAYMTNLITGNWERAPEDFNYNPARLFNPDDGLGPIMEDIENPELVGSESVDGRQAHQITGTVTGDQIKDITAGSIEGEEIDVTLWIAEDNSDVIRLFLSAPGADDANDTTWNLTFSNHNQDVTIEAPI